jgi:hypothetical protein
MIGIQICAWARLQRPEGVFGCKRYWDTKGNASLSVRYASRRDTQHEPTWWTAKGIGSLASFNRAMLTSAFLVPASRRHTDARRGSLDPTGSLG